MKRTPTPNNLAVRKRKLMHNSKLNALREEFDKDWQLYKRKLRERYLKSIKDWEV
jgi:hypothetical protein